MCSVGTLFISHHCPLNTTSVTWQWSGSRCTMLCHMRSDRRCHDNCVRVIILGFFAVTCTEVQRFHSARSLYFQVFWAVGACFEVLLALWVMPSLGWQYLLGFSSLPLLVFSVCCVVSVLSLLCGQSFLYTAWSVFSVCWVVSVLCLLHGQCSLSAVWSVFFIYCVVSVLCLLGGKCSLTAVWSVLSVCWVVSVLCLLGGQCSLSAV